MTARTTSVSGRLRADAVAVVTGAGRGIGAATAKRLAADGAAVVALDPVSYTQLPSHDTLITLVLRVCI
ncbi:SDR family NAD(P)-dependent oxidoreductase [Streptomyces sp. NPDC058534]|uniref:SDR family NAD(P)-dependent oxidoreductase n=1 Tax=Streptomyces sp. NPDC058534 TaxID=3346541 RepID=UPI0036515287